jgi:phospholipid/cholesterol/gamma-HCH transport system ATP-binding protein
MIEIRNLKKSFDGAPVLRGVSITIHDGETVAVIGASGSGKSVLLKHIIGLLTPDEGAVIVDGIHVEHASEKQIQHIRSRIGFLFQGAALFDSMTVEENITLGLRDHQTRGLLMRGTVGENPQGLAKSRKLTEEELKNIVREKLALVGLRGIERKKPAELSGGMRKRVGLARALAMEPAYMFYDEPTTGLDPISSDQIDRLIERLTETLSVTSIVVTHDMFTVYRIAKRVIFLYEGLIHFDGTPEHLSQSEDTAVKHFLERYVGPTA